MFKLLTERFKVIYIAEAMTHIIILLSLSLVLLLFLLLLSSSLHEYYIVGIININGFFFFK